VAISAAALTGCGDSRNASTDRTAKQIVDAARLGGEGGVRSARVEISLEVEAEGSIDPAAAQPFRLKLSGPFEGRGSGRVPAFDFAVTVEGAGQSFAGAFTSTGDNGYLSVAGTPYEVGSERFAELQESIAKLGEESGSAPEGGLALLGIEIGEWLTDLRKREREQLGGVDVEHVSGAVAVAKLLEDLAGLPERARELGLPQAEGAQPLREADRRRIERAVERIAFDLFVGVDDDVVRRFEALFVAGRPRGAGSSVPERTTIRFSLALSEVNEGQEIKAPKNPRPLSELAASPLGQALGGDDQGGGGAESERRGGGRGGSSRYIECIQTAKGADELRDCEKLLE